MDRASLTSSIARLSSGEFNLGKKGTKLLLPRALLGPTLDLQLHAACIFIDTFVCVWFRGTDTKHCLTARNAVAFAEYADTGARGTPQ